MMYRFLDTYRKIGKDFIRPKFHFFFGKWLREPNLPIWRRGNAIRFTKYYKECDTEYRGAKLINSWWTEEGKKNHPIISKIFKPVYYLPIWLSFYVFNFDVVYKTKWTDDDFRFEFPPQFTIVFFGFAFSVTAYIPAQKEIKDFTVNDDYWESMLTYNYYKGDLKKCNEVLGYWGGNGNKYYRFRPWFLKDKKKQEELQRIQKDC